MSFAEATALLYTARIWINDWAIVWDEFEEGGFKRSGNGRLSGLTAKELIGFLEQSLQSK